MDTLLYKITITGRVQGVGFRHSASSVARRIGLKGYVRNREDGSVYVEAEGNRNQLDEFVAWCRKGPGFGFVENVRLETDLPVNHRKFHIRYD